jgi:hypothetical protein
MLDGWLRLAAAVERTSWAAGLRASAWGYPTVEALHIWGLAVLVGTAVAFDLRLLGFASSLPVEALARLLLPCARAAFAVAALSGALLFSTQATTFAVEPLFFVKMGLIGVAILNSTLFHRGAFRSAHVWGSSPATPTAAKGAALVSLTAWTAALVCGRLLAYV